jgi:uncharacterized protein
VLVLALGGFALRQHLFDSAALALKDGNYQQAASKLKPLAQLCDSQAQDLLGDLYAFGWGVPKDDSEAIRWYRRAGTGAAKLKDRAAPAMYFVGKRYLEGTGVARDEVEARKWFERSAEGGYAEAAQQLAQLPHR